jgi:hypothetical protein
MIHSFTKTRIGAIVLLGLFIAGSTTQALTRSTFLHSVGMVAGAVCAVGTSQDYTCLETNGAIAPDSSIDDKKAAELAKSGVCKCQDGSGGAVTATIPIQSTEISVDVFVNQQANAAWGFTSVSVKAFNKGVLLNSKTFITGGPKR